jgi:ATP-binding cassette subfamily F protein uup
MSTVRNLVNVSAVSKRFAARTILGEVTLGIADGERIGVVGGNGQGKSTLLALIAGTEEPDAGAVTRTSALSLKLLAQDDELAAFATVADALVGDRKEHEWAADRGFRDVLDGLLGGVTVSRFERGLETPVSELSGGERRRIALARMLLDRPQLLLLDEPTNHLDVDAIDWLAAHVAKRRGALIVVTHDRWFLDAVCTATWEVADAQIHRYEGGYAAYVLAKAERDRIAQASETRRRQLVRKELAWLRRGPPARTSKPRFRIEAANALIADEPPARDRTELLRFAASRLGNKVIEVERISFAFGNADGHVTDVIRDVTWLLGPGDRIALVGANGSGKTTLLKLLAGELAPTAGKIDRGQTVRLAYLSQDTGHLDQDKNVIESLEQVRKIATLSQGVQLTAAKLGERFGFRGDRARTPVRELSGGERRRLALMLLLMDEPNLLLLDEPTNDLDIETLTALEDLLDGWPGTLVAVSHDRYFVERACDDVYALTPEQGIAHLPGGIDQYLQSTRAATQQAADPTAQRQAQQQRQQGQQQGQQAAKTPGAQRQAARKEIQRLERELERASQREQALQQEMTASASDHARLGELDETLRATQAEREQLEVAWLEAAELLES